MKGSEENRPNWTVIGRETYVELIYDKPVRLLMKDLNSLLFSYGRDPSGSLILSFPDLLEVRHAQTVPSPAMYTGSITLGTWHRSAHPVKITTNL